MRLRRFRKLRRNRNYATMVLVAFVGILSVMGIGYSYLQQRLSMDISLSKKNNEEFVEDYFAHIIASKNVNWNTEGLALDDRNNIRYRGADSDVKNYVLFNDETWRIIGIFDGGYVKLVRNESIGKIMWSTGGENNWNNATLKTYLNGNYYNGFTVDAKNQVSNHTFYLGGFSGIVDSAAAYDAERGSAVYPGNPTSVIQRVGLLYPSDYGFAARENCYSNLNQLPNDNNCNKNGNWLFKNEEIWFQSPGIDNAYGGISTRPPGYVTTSYYYTDNDLEIYPVVYLKMNVVCNGGTGTSTDPYTLSTTLGPLTTDPINNPMNPHPTSTATTTGTGTGTGGTTAPTTGTGTPTTGTPTTGTPTTTGPTTGTPPGTTTPTGTVTPTTTTPIMTTSNSPVTTPNY